MVITFYREDLDCSAFGRRARRRDESDTGEPSVFVGFASAFLFFSRVCMLSLKLQPDNERFVLCLQSWWIFTLPICPCDSPPCKVKVIFDHTGEAQFSPQGSGALLLYRLTPSGSGFLSTSRMHSGSVKDHEWKQGDYWPLPYSWRKLVNVSKSCSGRNDHTAVCIPALLEGEGRTWSSILPVIKRSEISIRSWKCFTTSHGNISQHKKMRYFMSLWNNLEILASSLIIFQKNCPKGTKLEVWQ